MKALSWYRAFLYVIYASIDLSTYIAGNKAVHCADLRKINMSRIALLYMTREGQTGKITGRIAALLEQYGHEVFISDIGKNGSDFSLADFDSVVLGCSIRYGRHHKPFRQFIDNNWRQLADKQSYFFSVNLAARKPGRSLPSNNLYLQKFLGSIDWQPRLVEVFAGALLYPRYSFLDQKMIQLIMKITGGPTDPSQETEFTDWERVWQFARAIHRDLANPQVSKPDQTMTAKDYNL